MKGTEKIIHDFIMANYGESYALDKTQLKKYPDAVIFGVNRKSYLYEGRKEDNEFQNIYIIDPETNEIYKYPSSFSSESPLGEFLRMKYALKLVSDSFENFSLKKEYSLIINSCENKDKLLQFISVPKLFFLEPDTKKGSDKLFYESYSNHEGKLIEKLSKLPCVLEFIPTMDLLYFILYNIEYKFCDLDIEEKESLLSWDNIIL